MRKPKSTSPIRQLVAAALAAAMGLAATASSVAAEAASDSVAVAGEKPAIATSAISVSPRFNIGTMLVERHGERGTPLILIPGLASGAWVWQDVVKRFKDTHVVYVVTLAGFDGQPVVSGKVMQQALQSLKGLIVTQELDKPVLIGHSLGGVLSIALAQAESSLIAGVVSIDGLPVFPGTEAMPPAQRAAMVADIKAGMSGLDREKFASQQQEYMRGIGVLDAVTAERLAQLSAKSDPAATAEYMAETLALDLRPNLPRISVPVLLISPYNAADGEAKMISEAAKTAHYRQLMAGTPRLEVVSVSPARHFAMFDQPKLVSDAIGKYLQALGTP
jgi:pimeloyl-ACP methyl ester carboxylesterase